MFDLIRKMMGGTQGDYKDLLARGALIVDVRTPAEFNGGHIKGSINIPLDHITAHAADLKRKNKPVITCCRSGNRSGMAKGILDAAGLECYNGGAWDALQQKIR